MTPREYIDIARERWRFIVAALLLGLVAACAAIYLVPRQYAASVTVIVSPQPVIEPDGGAGDSEISGQRLGIYSELLSSTRLTRDVVASLGLAVTPEELARRITVTTTPDSVLLTATVTDASPDQAVLVANAVADQFIQNMAEIEQPADATRPAPVIGKVFEAAQPPAALVAPRPALYLAVGTGLGLLVGIGSALLRHTLDHRIKSRRQLEEILGVPVLGNIGRDPKIPSSPLVMYGAPHTPLAEAFRQLRTNVQFIDVDRQHKVLLVTSATSGEGRSTTVCNLGLALAEAGTRVLILDADLRDPSIARCLSIDGTVGLTDVLVNRISVERALQPIGPTLDVLPSGLLPPNPSELLASNRMVNLLAALRGKYDVILVDTAPLIPVTDAAVLAPRVDGVLVLARHGRTVVQDVQAAKDALDAVSGRIIGSVMTMVSHGTRAHTRFKPGKGKRPPRSLGQVPADPSPRPSGGSPDPPPRLPGGHPAAPPQRPPGGSSAAPPRPPGEGRAPAPAPAPRQPAVGARPSLDAETQVLDRDGSATR